MEDDGAPRLILTLARTLPAPRELAFRALVEPGLVRQWWGPHGFTVPTLDSDPRPGGSYRFAMQPPAGEPFHVVGEFLEVEPPVLLTATFRWEPPDPDDHPTTVRIELHEVSADADTAEPEVRPLTVLRLRHGDFLTEERLALHRDGWLQSLERLARLLLLERGHALFDALEGRWEGQGTGDFPTMEPFAYDEEIVFSRLTDRHLRYAQHARDRTDGQTLHVEGGMWRLTTDGDVEATVALPGVAEVSEGSAHVDGVVLTSRSMSRATHGAPLVAAVRRYRLRGGVLTYEIDMGTEEVPVQSHIRAELARVG